MNTKSFSYEVKGTPNPLGDGQLLKLTENGKIVPAQKKPSKNPKQVTLRLISKDGSEEDIVKTVKYGGGPNTELKTLSINRAAFFAIVDRISADDRLTRSLISDWRREVLNYLQGGTSPIYTGYTSYDALLNACDPENPKNSAAVISDLGEYLQAQIVSDHATKQDLEGIPSVDRTFFSKG